MAPQSDSGGIQHTMMSFNCERYCQSWHHCWSRRNWCWLRYLHVGISFASTFVVAEDCTLLHWRGLWVLPFLEYMILVCDTTSIEANDGCKCYPKPTYKFIIGFKLEDWGWRATPTDLVSFRMCLPPAPKRLIRIWRCNCFGKCIKIMQLRQKRTAVYGQGKWIACTNREPGYWWPWSEWSFAYIAI